MADKQDIYVCVGKMSAKKNALDPKNEMTKVMTKTATRVVSKAKGVTTKTQQHGYDISATLTDLTQTEKSGKMTVACAVSILAAELPKKKIIATGNSKASIATTEKRLKADMEACVEAVMESVTADMIAKLLKLKR